jgi:hypothetical protein
LDTRPDEAEARKALAHDLSRIIESRLLDPLDILFGTGEMLRKRVREETLAWAALLLGDDDKAAAYTAGRLISALYPGDAPFDPPAQWWATPFGRSVALRVGHPTATEVPVAVAAAMLGMTRQGVHDLLHRGKLARDPVGGVTVASVRARLAARVGQTVVMTAKEQTEHP